MKTEQPNFYAMLGVDRHATRQTIHQAFADMRAEYQKRGMLETARFQQVAYAYEVLSNPERRALYDTLLHDATAAPALQVNAALSRTRIGLMNAPQVVYLLVEVRPPQQRADASLPLNLCLVLDRSTSMRGERLSRAQAAVEMVLDKLGPEDVISLVSFSDRAEVLLPPTKVQEKRPLLARIKSMTASGGTEIFHGLQAGAEQLRQVPLGRFINHLILLTDGHTYGDEDQCLKLAKETAVQGIGLTAFGIGLEWNERFLDNLVAPSSGQSGYIDQPNQIIEFLEQRIKGLGAIYARNVRFKINFPSTVYLRYGFKMTPYAQPIEKGVDYIQLGDIEGRRPLSFLLELSIDPQQIENRITLPIHLEAQIPGKKTQAQTIMQEMQIIALANPPQEDTPETLLKAVRMLNMYRLNEKIWHDVDSGNVDMATKRMVHLTTRLMEAGQTRLAQQAQMEVDRLKNLGDLSAEGRKSLVFGTRSLINRTMLLMLEEGRMEEQTDE